MTVSVNHIKHFVSLSKLILTMFLFTISLNTYSQTTKSILNAMEIKEFIEKEITLVFPMPYTVQTSDTYSMHAGCDKNFTTCGSTFSNAVNFRGEPHLPGADKMFETAGTMSG